MVNREIGKLGGSEQDKTSSSKKQRPQKTSESSSFPEQIFAKEIPDRSYFGIAVRREESDAFRETVQSFDGATIIYDKDAACEEELRRTYRRTLGEIDQLPHLVEDNKFSQIKNRYTELLQGILAHSLEEGQTVHIRAESAEEFLTIQDRIHTAFADVLHPREAGVIITRYGLLTGKKADYRQVSAHPEIGGITMGRAKLRIRHGFEKISAELNNDSEFARLIEIRRESPSPK